MHDDEANDGTALFKTVEAFRGAFRQVFSAQLWLSYLYDHICD